MEENILKRFEEFLQQRCYKQKTIEIYLRYAGPSIRQMTWETTEDLFEQISCFVEKSQPVQISMRAGLNQFFLMQTGEEMKEHRKRKTQTDDDLNKLLCELSNYLREIRGYQNSSIGKCVTITKMFTQTLTKNGVLPNWSEVDALKVRDYINLRAKSISANSLAVEATNIRAFFRFLEYSGIKVSQSVFNLRITFPRSKQIIPRIFTEVELSRASDFYSAATEKGVRNKLIVLLMIQLGLRTSEISTIQLEDIHWRTGMLTIKSSKTKSEREMPFFSELGHLMEQYILYYRPQSEEKSLFLRIGRNRGSKMTTEQIRRVVRVVINSENLYSYWTGPHAFRRTLGSKLYNAGNGLKQVADILGHASITSTTAYAKVAIENLRSIAVDWPAEGVLYAE